LVCASCGSNHVGYGRHSYVCPSRIANKCPNDVYFRRDDAHLALSDLLQKELLSDREMKTGTAYVESMIMELQRSEDLATKDAGRGADVKRLEDELKALRKMTRGRPRGGC
jgi:hypothetical protein